MGIFKIRNSNDIRLTYPKRGGFIHRIMILDKFREKDSFVIKLETENKNTYYYFILRKEVGKRIQLNTYPLEVTGFEEIPFAIRNIKTGISAESIGLKASINQRANIPCISPRLVPAPIIAIPTL